MPPTVPINHYTSLANHRVASILLFHAVVFWPCLPETLQFSQGKISEPSRDLAVTGVNRRMEIPNPERQPKAGTPDIQLRAFQLQQLQYTLLELELPRLLAPDLPSNGYSLRDLNQAHSDLGFLQCRYFLSLPPQIKIGQFTPLLPSLDVIAVSQALSPEPNPNSPLPVKAMVVQYTTIKADRADT